MSDLGIDFLRPRGGLFVWLLWGFGAAGVAIAVASYLLFYAEIKGSDAKVQKLLTDLAKSKQGQEIRTTNQNPIWHAEAGSSISEDWNLFFDRIENIKLPGTRLTSLQVGIHPHVVRLTFELDSWSRVAELNEALNLAVTEQRWALQSATATSTPTSISNASVSAAATGIWVYPAR